MTKLRQYQLEDVEELIKHDSHGIFNEQRTGKTPTSLVAMGARAQGKILIVSTASMIHKWAEEARTWTDRGAYVYTGTTKQRASILEFFKQDPRGVLIISYGLLKSTKAYDGLVNTLKKLKISGLIVDEVHRAVGRSTSNFKSLRRLVTIPNRYYLTGTPAPNHPSQVWSILTMINPKEFSSYWRFVEDFFTIEQVRLPAWVQQETTQEVTGFLPDKEDEYVELLANHSIMRKRADVMPWLPVAEEPTQIKLPLTPTQIKYIDTMHNYFEAGHVVAQGVLDQLLRERQICLAPELLQLKGGSPKLDWLEDYISDYPDKSIIIFSRFTQFIQLIEKRIPTVGVLVGATPATKRNELINEFQSGTLHVLALQIDAGKEGITLDQADVLIFTDIYPPASDILQARDRLVATSEERNKPKEIIELMMADSYDEQLYQITKQKIEFTDIANNYIHYVEGRN